MLIDNHCDITRYDKLIECYIRYILSHSTTFDKWIITFPGIFLDRRLAWTKRIIIMLTSRWRRGPPNVLDSSFGGIINSLRGATGKRRIFRLPRPMRIYIIIKDQKCAHDWLLMILRQSTSREFFGWMTSVCLSWQFLLFFFFSSTRNCIMTDLIVAGNVFSIDFAWFINFKGCSDDFSPALHKAYFSLKSVEIFVNAAILTIYVMNRT